MRMAKFMAAVAVASMATAPVVAAPASLLSLRASTKADKENELAPAIIIGVIATAALIGGAVAIANNDDEPDSP